MNLKKILSAVLALVLMMSCAAFAEQSDADRIAELEAQVAELTAQLEQAQATIKAYEEERYVVTFDGGYVTLEECQTQYDQLVAMYEGYGYSVEGSEDYLRESVMQSLGERAIVLAKAKELGHDVIAEDVMASYETEARGAYESNVQAYLPYFQADGVAEEESRRQVEEFLASNNYTYESILTQMIDTHVNTAMYEAVTAGVALTEEDVQAAYDEAVAEDEAAYADDPYGYESTQAQGGTIYWNPEGYRAVKHVLVKFTDEQKTNYTEITGIIADLEARIEAAAAPAETAEAEDGEAAEPVDVAALEAELETAKGELDALYAALAPKAQEVIDRFNNGEDFDALMAEYGEDPGMAREPGMTTGYYVCAEQGAWEAAFNDGAMSIANIGEISGMVYGSNGIHIICYMADVTPGAVALETVRANVEENALINKKADVYADQIADWSAELNLEYHLERFK